MTINKHVDLRKAEKSETTIFKLHLEKLNTFETKNGKFWAKQNHAFLSD